jgi:hypothetical protein
MAASGIPKMFSYRVRVLVPSEIAHHSDFKSPAIPK